ncbi:hypothetical protein BOX15_Mlig006465g1 [Macrostomum lignano]|uniref:Schwannomin interacting protein 1 C-terminal domain-containing protein n=1 Tax=Macrostomum lignano TaxID=282301 RepID=A0A267G860_9PLAT|nr:hypothetical protein BOX15_Mlig006465g1 [Macrostomum lignano]
MDANTAAVRIQQAWRGWQNRSATAGSSLEEDEAAQTTSGYMSASSSAEHVTVSTAAAHLPPQSSAPHKSPRPPPPPRRSWTSAALPLNLHCFGDSSGDASPASSSSLAAPSPPPPPLSVGASRTDLTGSVQVPAYCDSWLPGLSSDYRSGPEAAMELCYRNDAASDFGDLSDIDCEAGGNGGGGGGGWQRFCRPSLLKNSEGSRSQQISGKSASRSLTRRPLEPELLESLGLDCNHEILSVHTRLRGEAQLALAQAKPMARMQLQLDSSPSDETKLYVAGPNHPVVVSNRAGFNWPGRLSENDLLCASRGALKMLHRCLLTKIDACNSELVNCLVERDDLHMEQDSLLIEVEDLTRRAKEAARRLNAKELGGWSDSSINCN